MTVKGLQQAKKMYRESNVEVVINNGEGEPRDFYDDSEKVISELLTFCKEEESKELDNNNIYDNGDGSDYNIITNHYKIIVDYNSKHPQNKIIIVQFPKYKNYNKNYTLLLFKKDYNPEKSVESIS